MVEKYKDIEVTEVALDYPADTEKRHLSVSVGACSLNIEPDDQIDEWITATYRHPADVPPILVSQDGGNAHLRQEASVAGLGSILRGGRLFLDVKLGTDLPYALTLNGGAFDANVNLGGVPIQALKVNSGAGKLVLDFSEPNPHVMDTLNIESGAMSLEVKNLGNANFNRLQFKGGVSEYTLDFGGVFEHDSEAHLDTGVSSLTLVIPSTTAAKVSATTSLGEVSADNGFSKQADGYWTQAALDGKKPTLTMFANVSLGSLQLRSS